MWSKPSKGRYKLNFDRDAKGNLGNARYRCIIHNDEGRFIHEIYDEIEISTNNEAKATTLERGIKLCVNRGICSIDIEGDSQVIINVVKNGQSLNWKIA